MEETQHPPTLQEIKQKIESYNSREKHCLGMKLVSRALFTPTRHPSAPPPPVCLAVVYSPVHEGEQACPSLSSILLCPSPQKQ